MHRNTRPTARRPRAFARIQDLPVELRQEIFIRACSDGGRTGCSLSAVSHSFRKEVFPVRYHSVALTGLAQVAAFTAHYQRVRATVARSPSPTSYPKVRHLYVMSHREMLRRKVYEHDDTDNDLDHAFSAMTLAPGRGRASTLAPLPALLRFVAPDLITLTLATTYAHTTLFAGCAQFPILRDLTIARMQGVDIPTVGAPALPRPLFPRLERLHIAMGVLDHSLEHLFCHWTELAPRTVKIRISDAPARVGPGLRETFGECFRAAGANGLIRVLTNPHGVGDRPRNYDPVFPRMRLLIVQPFPAPPSGRVEPPMVEGQRHELMRAIADLGRRARATTAVRFLESNYDTGAQHSVNLMQGWLEGVSGGPGFWAGGVDARRIR